MPECIDGVPVHEGIRDGSVSRSVILCEIREGFVREDDAPAEGLIRRVALMNRDGTLRRALLEQEGEVQRCRSTTDTDDVHKPSVAKDETSRKLSREGPMRSTCLARGVQAAFVALKEPLERGPGSSQGQAVPAAAIDSS